jgi:hypothetical protein
VFVATVAACGAAIAGPASKKAAKEPLEITDSNVKSVKIGKRVPKNAPMKLSGVQWVKYADLTTGKVHTCVGKYEGPLGSCPAPKPCGLLNIISDECGKNGVALP